MHEEAISKVEFPSITVCPPSNGKGKAIAKARSLYGGTKSMAELWSGNFRNPVIGKPPRSKKDLVNAINTFSKFAMPVGVSRKELTNYSAWTFMFLTEAEVDLSYMIMYSVHRFTTSETAKSYLTDMVYWAIVEAEILGSEVALSKMRLLLDCWLLDDGLDLDGNVNGDCGTQLTFFQSTMKSLNSGPFQIVVSDFTNLTLDRLEQDRERAYNYARSEYLPKFCNNVNMTAVLNGSGSALETWCQYLFLGSSVLSSYNFQNYIASLKVIFSFGINLKQSLVELLIDEIISTKQMDKDSIETVRLMIFLLSGLPFKLFS